MAVRLYTILLDYAGGTYIAQVSASSPRVAVSKWARAVPDNLGLIIGLDACWAIKSGFERDVHVERVDGVRSVWCTSALGGDELALVHIISTLAEPPNAGVQRSARVGGRRDPKATSRAR